MKGIVHNSKIKLFNNYIRCRLTQIFYFKLNCIQIFTFHLNFEPIMTFICVYLRSSAVYIEMITIPGPPADQGSQMYSAMVVHVVLVWSARGMSIFTVGEWGVCLLVVGWGA